MQDIILQKKDSVVYIDSLLPKTNYTFQAITQSQNQQIESNELSVVTLDTTSHNFTWQTFTFGDYASSVLNDVAIINENNIWAVGEIFMNDSLGNPDPTFYNAAHWNGQEWELKRILYGGWIWTIKTIFAFNANDIWFSAFVRYDGQNFIELPIPTILTGWTINKIWGTSSDDLYIVGNNGNIARWDGIRWRKIQSGTDKRLTDIYGTLDNKNIWACGWDNNHTQGIILKIFNSTTNIIWDGITNNGEYYGFINTLWTNGGEFWLAGGFVFKQSILFSDKGHLIRIPTENGSKLFDPGNFGLSIRGTEKNNIFLAGDLGMVWHYNGKSWYKYDELYSQQLDRRIYGISAKDNLVVAVGWKNSNSWIIIGRK